MTTASAILHYSALPSLPGRSGLGRRYIQDSDPLRTRSFLFSEKHFRFSDHLSRNTPIKQAREPPISLVKRHSRLGRHGQERESQRDSPDHCFDRRVQPNFTTTRSSKARYVNGQTLWVIRVFEVLATFGQSNYLSARYDENLVL